MTPYSVTEFLQAVNESLAADFGMVRVQGEISDWRVSGEKWIWFTLKDENSSMSCFMTLWQLKASDGRRISLEDGMEVKATGTVAVFNKSGKFTFKPQYIELVGEGTLKRQMEMVMKKLEQEGLFDKARKRALPQFPDHIGLITSKEAAAYSDFLKILNARWSTIRIDFYHTAVQGEGAVMDIVKAFEYFNRVEDKPQVLVLTRGGGSLEDLMAFNTEEVARAVYGSKTPVICAIGHERDINVAELVSDVRASTPSNAAELLIPDKRAVSHHLLSMARTLENSVVSQHTHYSMSLETYLSRLHRFFEFKTNEFQKLRQNLESLFIAFEEKIAYTRHSIDEKKKLLASLAPYEVLKRGYTITRDMTGKAVTSIKELQTSQEIKTVFIDGEIESKIYAQKTKNI